jgi:hypothetical protein
VRSQAKDKLHLAHFDEKKESHDEVNLSPSCASLSPPARIDGLLHESIFPTTFPVIFFRSTRIDIPGSIDNNETSVTVVQVSNI